MKASVKYKRLQMRHCNQYEPEFKKNVILFAEKKGNGEAKKRYGVCESNIRRWRRMKAEIIEKANQPKRRSLRKRKHFPGIYTQDHDSSKDSLDSMPLRQRLNLTNQANEQQQSSSADNLLHSQPLSPTKLKVTRQKFQHQPPSPAKSPEPPNDEVCLRWNSHHVNMKNAFPAILSKEQYVDVTLVAEGKTLKCHRMILSSCSPYFEEVLNSISPYQHPVLFMRDTPFWILKALCDFMYAGEVHIYQNKLQDLLTVAELLKIKGLAGKQDDNQEQKAAETPPEQIKKEEIEKEDRRKKELQKTRKSEEKGEEKRKEDRREDKRKSPVEPVKAPVKIKPQKKVEVKKDKRADDDDEILDPLDLLEPIYEEPAKEERSMSLNKNKDNKYVPSKKPIQKKFKKRKYSDLHEDSPPPMFPTRKGTRSRPNVKMPKYYESDFEQKEDDNIIERQPHTNLITDSFYEVAEIKTEPMDFDNDVIEIEENNITDDEEAIIGNYDSPIVNIAPEKEIQEEESVSNFQKIKLVHQPILITSNLSKNEDPLNTDDGNKDQNDPLEVTIVERILPSKITIASVESVQEEKGKDIEVTVLVNQETVDVNTEGKEKSEENLATETTDEITEENVPNETEEDNDDENEKPDEAPNLEEINESVPNEALEDDEKMECNSEHISEAQIENSDPFVPENPEPDESCSEAAQAEENEELFSDPDTPIVSNNLDAESDLNEIANNTLEDLFGNRPTEMSTESVTENLILQTSHHGLEISSFSLEESLLNEIN